MNYARDTDNLSIENRNNLLEDGSENRNNLLVEDFFRKNVKVVTPPVKVTKGPPTKVGDTQYEQDLGLNLEEMSKKADQIDVDVPYYSTNVILKRFLDNKSDFVARQNKRGPEPNLRKVNKEDLKA